MPDPRSAFHSATMAKMYDLITIHLIYVIGFLQCCGTASLASESTSTQEFSRYSSSSGTGCSRRCLLISCTPTVGGLDNVRL